MVTEGTDPLEGVLALPVCSTNTLQLQRQQEDETPYFCHAEEVTFQLQWIRVGLSPALLVAPVRGPESGLGVPWSSAPQQLQQATSKLNSGKPSDLLFVTLLSSLLLCTCSGYGCSFPLLSQEIVMGKVIKHSGKATWLHRWEKARVSTSCLTLG